MTSHLVRRFGAALAAAVIVGPAVADEKPASGAGPVAVVAGRAIDASTLDEAVEGPLMDLRAREFQIRSQALEVLIAQALLEREAEARGVAPGVLERTEILDKAAVTDEDAKRFYEANKGRFGGATEADAIKQIKAGLGQQRERERRLAFARELRAKHEVKVFLEPIRMPVEVAGAPIRGNPKAPVTVVEFSDFQCPFCSRSRPTVARVRETYGDSVRWVFRHFPLDFHQQARKAGEAGACAAEQGKFWEMHDAMFANPGRLQVADLKETAKTLGLDTAAFGECLDSGRHGGLVERDLEAGSRYGVSGTPAFFVNGRPIIGAQPFEAFQQVIDDELQRLGKTAASAAK
jgi:predicted DsbA family dithiol-disulfide isomerase